ncbi:MAG: sodium/proline symporter [Lachnospiraceae bacterium]|nr:sodium/proline symporter [Lachnospiraceae bacterium]
MSGAQLGMLMVIVAYLVMMLVIGFLYSKGNNDSKDFYLGGRRLGPFVTAMSAEASDMSSWLLMGLPGVAYLSGVCDAAWTAIGLAWGTYMNWLIVAKRLRRYSARIHAITLPDFFSNRYRDESRVLLAVSSIFIIIFFVPYTASGFAACGKLFSTLFGMPYTAAMLISAVVIVGYTALGGFMAASTTDLIQSVVMSIALVIVVLFGIGVGGGWDSVMANAAALPGYLSLNAVYDGASNSASPYGMITIVSTMAWGLGYFGMPHILLRFMATENEKNIPLSRRIATVWVVISMGVAILIGIVGYSMSQTGAIDVLSGSDSETIVIRIATLLSRHGALAILGAGITLAGILACTMSTADSQLLAASSSVSENLIKGILGVNLSERATILTARSTVVVIAVIAVFLAGDPNSSVFGIVSFAWAGFGAVFGPLMLCALFWKRSNRQGAIAGMIGGGSMVFIWKYCVKPLGGIWNIYELLPAFLVSLALIIGVSLATAEPQEEIVREFEAVRKEG